MTWRPWRRRLAEAEEAVRHAEVLRDAAERQQARVAGLGPRVDAVSASLQKLRQDNHLGPLIESVLRSSE